MTYIGELLINGINVQEAIKRLRNKIPENELLILHLSPGHKSFILLYQESILNFVK